jgi:hypothetical protein
MGLACGDEVKLCLGTYCVYATVNDVMPQSSADRYGGKALDGSPAVMRALKIPYGFAANGKAYGRAVVEFNRVE